MNKLCSLFLFSVLTASLSSRAASSTIVFNSTNPVSGVSIVVSTTVTNAAVTANPANTTALTNSDVEFTATASGNLLSYYWITNGALAVDGSTLAGATTTSLILSNVVIGQSNMPVAFIVSNYCTVVTSAVATLTVTNSPGGGGGATNFVTGFSVQGAILTNVDLWVGCVIDPAVNTNIYTLGRWVNEGDSQVHSIVVVNHTAGTIIASNQVDLSGASAGTWKYVDITATNLVVGNQYYLLSRELASGGDKCYSGYLGDTAVTFQTNWANISASCWIATNDVLGSANIYTGTGWTYGPVDIKVGP